MEKSQEISVFSLPPEIIFQILKELPVKSLLRLKCVSKLWCSIIDDPFFVQSHHTRSHTCPGGISILHYDNTCRLELADPEFDSVHHILNLPRTYFRNPQYHNGLICIDNYISNPSTRECIIIPPPLRSKTKASFEESSKELDPQYFLGFDPSSNKYKVLYRHAIITKLHNRREIMFEYEYKILTFGTNSWRDIDCSISCHRGIISRSCSIAGFIYFIHSNSDEYVLEAFEVGQEKFSVVSLPEGANSASFLVQVGERLAVMDFDRKTIWILEDCRKQLWNRQSLVMMYEGEPLINNNGLLMRPYGTIHTSEILVGLFFSKEASKLSFYDLERKKLRILKTMTPNVHFYAKYVESLFRLKGL
ncbi:putative F-box protein At4g38870 [Cornus florida]|uniref:putative F-box protein At4g38870 n=1 Tax=Cornus florida TaxID=4283 RepID=UPI0028972F8B|nr:putative F-box protein At4g38870 [Cornus florida]